MSDAWHFSSGGQSKGPITWAQMQQLAAAGALKPGDFVWTEGMDQWLPASQMPELFAAPAAAGPTPQPSAAPLAQMPQPQASLNYYGAPPPAFVYGGFWLRFCAVFLDGLILGFGCGIPMVIILAVFSPQWLQSQDPTQQLAVQGIINLVSIVANWLYFTLQESSAAQATLGKRAMGLIVTDMNGQRITFGKASGRFFGKIVSGLICYVGFIMAGFTEKKQALHDMMAGTLVVRRS
jgi:uncharacterized RDD family membrane protein YckC